MNEQQHKIKILALFGESGTGKSTIQNWMVQNFKNTNKIISYTTRPKRDYETDGEDYFFITSEQFEKILLEGELLEATTFGDWFYGTPVSAIKPNRINIGVFNITGIESLQEYHRFNILPVRVMLDDKTRLLRTINRELNPNCYEICRRFLEDQKDFLDIPFDYTIFDNNNEDYVNSVKQNFDIEQFICMGKTRK